MTQRNKNNRKKATTHGVPSIVHELAVVLVFTVPSNAFGTIVEAGGAVLLISDPPRNATLGALQSNENIRAWPEQHCFHLESAIQVDIDGTPGTYNSVASLRARTVQPGFVDSDFLHLDLAGSVPTTLTGFAVLAAPILGVQVLGSTLDRTDTLFTPGTVYPTAAPSRGLEFETDLTERITISPDRLRIDITLGGKNDMDQIRIITEAKSLFVRGDINVDGKIHISDPVFLLNFIFLGSPLQPACEAAADVNGDGRLNISDAIYELHWVFLGSRPPPPPTPTLAADTTYRVTDCGPDPMTHLPCSCSSFPMCP
jgi:hypothetical protein